MKLALPTRILFPATLGILIGVFGLSGFHAEEDPNDTIVYDRTESVLHLSLDAPWGTSLSSTGPAANVGIYVQRHSWEIWRQPSTGFEEFREATNAAESGASVSLSLSAEMGTLGDTTVITDAGGRAATTYSPDGGIGGVYVNAVVENSTGSLFFDVTYTAGSEETWSYSHTEATLVAELSTSFSTDSVYPGETRDLSLSVRYETWDVMTGSQGNSRTENHTSAPAEGASINWVSESGDASVSGYSTVNSTGLCQGSLMMGSVDSVIRAEISYAAGQAASASLYFTAAPYAPTYGDPTGGDPGSEWSYSRSETIASIINLSADGTTELSMNESRTISGEVRAEVWDIWVNGYGTEEWRYNYSGLGAWVTVSAGLEFGDGSLSSSSATTDGQGWFSVTYTMSSTSARITFSTDGTNPASGSTSSVDFHSYTGSSDYGSGGNPEPTWSHLYNIGNYRFDGPHSDGPTYDLAPGTQRTLSGVVYRDSWEVWGDQYGNTTIQNQSSLPVASTTVSVGMALGDGIVPDTQVTTNALGGFSAIFTMGLESSRVRFQIAEGTVDAAAVELDFTPNPTSSGDEWVHTRSESSLFVSLSATNPEGATTSDPSLPLRAQVTETTWEVWENGSGSLELRNHTTGPAIGAAVSFSVISGSGDLIQIDYLTDADGAARAEIIPAQTDTVVSVSVSFHTTEASGEITVSPVPWTYQNTESRLVLSLESTGGLLAATVRLQSWETWMNPANGSTEIRHESEGPAANAEVTFQSLSVPGYESAAFNPSLVMTGIDGTGATTYTSLGQTWVEVTANFAGVTVTESIQLPAWIPDTGSGGTTGGGTTGGGTDGGGTDGGGTTGGGTTDGGTTGGGTNGNQNNQQPNPDLPIPETAVKGRTHSTSGGHGSPGQPAEEALYGTTFLSGTEQNIDEYWALIEEYPDCAHTLSEGQIVVSFTALLTLNTFAFDGITITDVTEVHESGPWNEKDEILNPYFEQNYLLSEYHEDFQTTAVWEVSFDTLLRPAHDGYDASGNDFVITGRQGPDSDLDTIATISHESEIASLYDSSGSPPSPSVYLPPVVTSMGLESSFSTSSNWDESGRISYGKRGLPAPPTSSSADFIDGVVPSVSWNEYWFQAEEVLPTGSVETKKSLILHAKQTDNQGAVTEDFATVTFTIRESKEISDAQPEIEGLEGQFSSWVEAKSDGTLLVKPPVERGMRNEVSLPVEVVELSPKVKDEEGNDIEGSEKPNSGKPLTPFVEVDPHANKIAHRELKVKIGEALKDKKVTWTLEPLPEATPAAIRGDWEQSPNHKDRFEASTAYGANGFNKVSQTTGETTIAADGHTAIRVNVPPIGFNQVRIKIQIEGMATPVKLIDMEVPGVVVIDPGHGAHDPGAVGRTDYTIEEKDLALAYGLKLRNELIDKFTEEKRGFRIVMTRDSDEDFVVPQARPQLARDSGADILVSIHFNSSDPDNAGNYARGTETFVQGTGNHNLNEDAALAGALQHSTVSAIQSQDANGRHRTTYSNNWVLNEAGNAIPGVKTAGLAVTKDGDTYNGNTEEFKPVKACLLEVEFLSNENALNTVKIPGASGEAIRDSFTQGAATDVYDDILNQP